MLLGRPTLRMIFTWGAVLLPACSLVFPASDLVGEPLPEAGSFDVGGLDVIDAGTEAAPPADAADEDRAVAPPDAAACRVAKAPATPCTSGDASSCIATIVGPAATLSDGGPTNDTFTFGIAVDEANVFWITQADPNGHSAGVLHRAPKDGGAPTTLTAPDGPYPAGTALALDSTYVYWLGPGDLGTVDVARIRKDSDGCDAGCVPPTQVGTTEPQGDLAQSQIEILPGGGVLAISATSLWSPTSKTSGLATGGFPSMALWQKAVVWVSSKSPQNSNPLNWAPVDDLLAASMLANPPAGGAKYITSDCTRVFASIFDPAFGVSALDPADPDAGWQTVLAPGTKEGFVYSLAADEAYVYVGYAGQGGLDRVDVKARQLEHNFHGYSVWGIALDDEAIYFGDHGEDGRLSGEILRITK